ncbi:serine hydrolase domain-containing protein [Nakamurella lactea]|uniref:serine hydrolase domain-containing protein n=1 Tax=Nakamurella lactea TaxID=459515 RepID=UPI00041BC271|nr:serine hydrolase domain-containing protein [Nakamurella lactea]
MAPTPQNPPAVATTDADLQADLQEFLGAAAADLGVPGAAVGITYRGVDTVAVTGVTSLADPLPIDADTLFMIGSTSKTYTATLAMSLVQQGLLDLDRPVHEYLPDVLACPPELREQRAAVRVCDLFTHTAGWVGDVYFDAGPGDDALARAVHEQLPTVPQHTAPGNRASYNNLSMVVAARLVEVLAGGSYEALLRSRVLEPIGLTNTFLFPAEVANRRHAVGHREVAGRQVPMPDWPLPRCFTPTGGVLSSVRDQLAYARFQLTGRGAGDPPIDDTTREMMRRPRSTMNPAQQVGINWLLRERAGLQLVAHGGNVSYLQLSAFAMVPEAEFAVSTLTNARPGEKLGGRVLDWALQRVLGAQATPLPTVPPPGDLAELVGDYGTGDAFVAVREGAGALTVQTRYPAEPSLDGPVLPAHFIGPDLLATNEDPAEPGGVFLRDADGRVDALRWSLRLGNRLPTDSASPDSTAGPGDR